MPSRLRSSAKKVSIASVVRRKLYTASLGKHVSVRKHSGRGAWSKSNTAMTPYMKVKSTVTTSIGTIMVRLMLMQRSIIIGVSHMGSTRKTWSERNEKRCSAPRGSCRPTARERVEEDVDARKTMESRPSP